MQEASFYEKRDGQVVICFLCPHYCTLEDGEYGRCKAGLRDMPPGMVVNETTSNPDNVGIAYTYNEPTIWYEYMYDIAIKAVDSNLKNVVVSNLKTDFRIYSR